MRVARELFRLRWSDVATLLGFIAGVSWAWAGSRWLPYVALAWSLYFAIKLVAWPLWARWDWCRTWHEGGRMGRWGRRR